MGFWKYRRKYRKLGLIRSIIAALKAWRIGF